MILMFPENQAWLNSWFRDEMPSTVVWLKQHVWSIAKLQQMELSLVLPLFFKSSWYKEAGEAKQVTSKRNHTGNLFLEATNAQWDYRNMSVKLISQITRVFWATWCLKTAKRSTYKPHTPTLQGPCFPEPYQLLSSRNLQLPGNLQNPPINSFSPWDAQRAPAHWGRRGHEVSKRAPCSSH